MSTQASFSDLGQQLKTLAREAVIELPELYQMAWDVASHLLATLGVQGDPNAIHWHRFDNSQSSHRSFTGYVHVGPPTESMTFTELVMQRFRVGDQDNGDVLQVMGGFYHADAGQRFYDEHSEVRLLPAQVLNALWEVNFSQVYHGRMTAFWAAHTGAVSALIRLNCLAAAIQACEVGEVSRLEVQRVFDGLGVRQAMVPVLADFTGEHSPQGRIDVQRLRVAGHDLVSVLCFGDPAGARLLYLAGRQSAFEAFTDEAALQAWLHVQLQHPDSRDHLLAHGRLLGPSAASARSAAFAALGTRSLAAARSELELLAMTGDAGAWLCEQTRQQMAAEADLHLRGNGDLRKDMWVGYLGAGLRAFGAGAMVAWPVALLVVVASGAKFALQVDQAVNAKDPRRRSAAILAAVFSGIELLLNLTLLIPASRPLTSELLPFQADPAIAPLAPALPGTDGVLMREGLPYARLDGRLYQIRRDPRLDYWLIVDPQRPFAFNGNYPVRFNEQLQWELLDRPCLLGGGQCLGKGVADSQLPDFHEAFQLPTPLYEVPVSARGAVRELYRPEYRNLLSGLGLESGHPLEATLAIVNRLRGQLIQDSLDFIEQWRRNPRPRSALLAPDSSLPVPLAFQRLVQESRGVVIGESHIATSSKRLLIENMHTLAREGVDTLYMEHLMSDLHQVWLEKLRRSGNLPTRLQDYLRGLDQGHGLDITSEYSFTRLVQAACREGIKVRALDCAASYRLDGMDDVFDQVGSTLRHQVFSYYASRVIGVRQAASGAGKWVALVGNTHASTYKGVPGLAQLEDVLALRVVDAGAGQGTGMTLDPGEFFLPSMGRPDGVVRGDWRLALQVRVEPYEYLDPSLAPPGVVRP
ncbi:membrane-targeted effector domain-containing toxin [Pseudomonas sp. dw_358]|uniref:membrane-targeted effector domain-containing toxin n=1 Tax=Pseudomonas sp. dw_358 TaxID=2720083 RepID=UPI001BD3964F|nr:membrane-targeted effector domain-containing toxin [Pseudomonas sp. dw_358]